ncbi:MAG: hypothetical protein ABI239_14600 [Aquihabitans sp.]
MTSEPASPVDDDIWSRDDEAPSPVARTDELSLGDGSDRPPAQDDTVTTERWSRRDRLLGYGIVVAGFVAVVVSLRLNHAGLHESEIATSWQLDSVDNLMANPFTSTWYRHVQPPLYNLYIGSILRWSPFPPIGTIYVLSLAVLLGASLLLCDVLQRWRVHPWAAGLITAVAMANPNLLSTIVVSSYEVPVVAMLVLAFWLFQRYLDQPSPRLLIGLSVVLTAVSLTRSLLHPVWVVGFVAFAVLARKVPVRTIAVAVAIPVLCIGGWMVKNEVLFDTATTSSWLGFNLQRGVMAPMARADVEASVADGDVTGLALVNPWQPLEQYDEWNEGCQPSSRHPSLYVETWKESGRAANFNHECYLPLYAQAEANATTLIRTYPGRYLRTRVAIAPSSFAMAEVGVDTPYRSPAGVLRPTRTWMDSLGDATLVPMTVHLDMADWNLPFFGADELTYRISLTLAAGSLFLLARGLLAAFRLMRQARRPGMRSWDRDELMWLLVAGTAILVIVVGNLIEFGENGRFRATLDPLLVALPLGALYRTVADRVGPETPPDQLTA